MAIIEVGVPPERVDVEIFTDGGPWLRHNMFCSVCHEEPAVFSMNSNILQPCWKCQKAGYRTRKGGLLTRIEQWFRGE